MYTVVTTAAYVANSTAIEYVDYEAYGSDKVSLYTHIPSICILICMLVYIYDCLLAYFGILFIDSRTAIDFQTSQLMMDARRSFSRRPVSRSRVCLYLNQVASLTF